MKRTITVDEPENSGINNLAGFLQSCIDSKIWTNTCRVGDKRPTDIDFMMQEPGRYLIGEFKSRYRLPDGQRILFSALMADLPNVTFFILVGNSKNYEMLKVFHPDGTERLYRDNKYPLPHLIKDWLSDGKI